MEGKNKTILIVEDEASILNALVNKFSKEGFKVISGKNGEEGLKLALKKKPDLILLDIIMPIMDGVSVLKELKQDSWGVNAKVIILTNLSEGEDVFDLLDSGEQDYLIKSDWKLDDVVKKVRELLK